MAIYLLLASVVIFACVLLNKISFKLGIPTLFAFIFLGMVFGSDGILKIPFSNYDFAERICSTALIFIMFYGGFGTNLNQAKPIAVKAILLSSVGVILTSCFTGLFCYYVLKIEFLESLLIGSIISSTDAASVFSILRSKRLNLKYNTASILEVESGSNDPFAYMLTSIILTIKSGTATLNSITYMVFAQLFYGIIIALLIFVISSWCLRKIKFATDGFDAVFMVGVALLSYAAPSYIGGNGYLSAYIVGIMLGNCHIPNKKSLVPFFDGVTGLMQMLIFFLLGLLSFPSRLEYVIFPSILIALFLTFIARPISIFMLMMPFKSPFNQQLLVSWAGLRGAASIVFAVMALMNTSTENDIFHIVFFVVLFSILVQGSLIPYISKKLNMIDINSDVMKTFSDYSDEVPIQFIKFTIEETHPWNNSYIKDIILPPDTILVLLQRNNEHIVPNGNTKLISGDKLVLSAKSPDEIKGVRLSERTISSKDEYEGKMLSQLPNDKNALVIMIQRNDKIIIPNGSTVLMANDKLVINHSD